jgi:uncharacterized membrane protein YjgN (DUF898 family)
MTTLTVVLINVHAHLIFFCQFQFLTNQRKFEQDRFQKFQKVNLLYLHYRTHFTKVILAKIL